MVNSVQNAAQQAYLNPFQSKNGQVQNQQNGKEQQTAETKGKGSDVNALTKAASEEFPSTTSAAETRETRSEAQNSRPSRGSLLDITV